MRIFLVALAIVALPLPGGPIAARAETAADAAVTQPAAVDVAQLAAILGIGAQFDLVAQEGAGYGRDIEAAMFPGQGGASWQAEVARIYGDPAMRQRFDTVLADALSHRPEVLAAAAAFFGSDTGQRILARELAARLALIDPDTLEEAEVEAAKLAAARDPRLRLVRRVIEAGAMIEQATLSGMSGHLAFNAGLDRALPAEQRLPPEDLTSGVWGQEGQMRADAAEWLVSYLVLAYAPLDDADLRAYADFLATPEAGVVGAALSAAWDAALTPVMDELGYEAGQVIAGRGI